MSAATSQQELVNFMDSIEKERNRRLPGLRVQREKNKLRLQIRLIAAGACGYKIPNIVELKGENLKRFTYGIFDLYGQTIWNEPRTDSIDTMTDYLFEKGIRGLEG